MNSFSNHLQPRETPTNIFNYCFCQNFKVFVKYCFFFSKFVTNFYGFNSFRLMRLYENLYYNWSIKTDAIKLDYLRKLVVFGILNFDRSDNHVTLNLFFFILNYFQNVKFVLRILLPMAMESLLRLTGYILQSLVLIMSVN